MAEFLIEPVLCMTTLWLSRAYVSRMLFGIRSYHTHTCSPSYRDTDIITTIFGLSSDVIAAPVLKQSTFPKQIVANLSSLGSPGQRFRPGNANPHCWNSTGSSTDTGFEPAGCLRR